MDDIRGFDDLEESDQQSISEAIDGWFLFSTYAFILQLSSILTELFWMNLPHWALGL